MSGTTSKWTKVVEGIIVGVTAGLILSGVQFAVNWCIERQQIGYINEIFSNTYANLCERRDEGFEPKKLFTYYTIVLNTMELIIENRTNRISYDKIYDLRLLVEAAQIDKRNNYEKYEQWFTVKGRVAAGSYPPAAPTDPGVPHSGTRLLR